jgi:hypothetical protein
MLYKSNEGGMSSRGLSIGILAPETHISGQEARVPQHPNVVLHHEGLAKVTEL